MSADGVIELASCAENSDLGEAGTRGREGAGTGDSTESSTGQHCVVGNRSVLTTGKISPLCNPSICLCNHDSTCEIIYKQILTK